MPVSALVSLMVCFMTTVPIRVSDASEHKSPSTTLVVCLTASQLPHLLQSPVFLGVSSVSLIIKIRSCACPIKNVATLEPYPRSRLGGLRHRLAVRTVPITVRVAERSFLNLVSM